MDQGKGIISHQPSNLKIRSYSSERANGNIRWQCGEFHVLLDAIKSHHGPWALRWYYDLQMLHCRSSRSKCMFTDVLPFSRNKTAISVVKLVFNGKHSLLCLLDWECGIVGMPAEMNWGVYDYLDSTLHTSTPECLIWGKYAVHEWNGTWSAGVGLFARWIQRNDAIDSWTEPEHT